MSDKNDFDDNKLYGCHHPVWLYWSSQNVTHGQKSKEVDDVDDNDDPV